MERNINVITDLDGRKIVLVNDIRFKSRRNLDWETIEQYLKEYIGQYQEIIETSEKVYIGSDFPDEFCGSEDRIRLKGANLKAKANIATAIKELIYIATNRRQYPDHGNKHGKRAQHGWYRYDTRFGIPVYEEDGTLGRYNIFTAQMLVRNDNYNCLYLYDFIKIKKETCSPHR